MYYYYDYEYSYDIIIIIYASEIRFFYCVLNCGKIKGINWQII